MYMVVFPAAQGKNGYHLAEELEEAIKFVEHLRNSEGVGEARLFRMTEIPLEVKAYYKVEIAGGPQAGPLGVAGEPKGETGYEPTAPSTAYIS